MSAFLLQPINMALLAIALISGLLLLKPLIEPNVARRLSTTDATALINQRGQVLDVRTAEEFADGHQRNAVHCPLEELHEFVADAKRNKLKKDKPVLIICERGQRARAAAKLLQQAGYTDLAILDNGLTAWREAQLPLFKS